MRGILLDTHILYWLVTGEESLARDALLAIGESQASGALYVSAITAWELGLAVRKPPNRSPPQIDPTVSSWFGQAVRLTTAKVVGINPAVALAAADVPARTGHRDPGDCFLIATAQVRQMSLVTRDSILRRLAREGHLDVIVG